MTTLGDWEYYLGLIIQSRATPRLGFAYATYTIDNGKPLFYVPNMFGRVGEYLNHSVVDLWRQGFYDQNESKTFSQDGSDGVIDYIFGKIGTTDKQFFEIGVDNGTECQTRYLREKKDWTGHMINGGQENLEINLHDHFVTKDNIISIMEKYDTPNTLDFLSIDIDGNDFYVLNEILKTYKPRVISAEYNASHFPHEDKIIKYDPEFGWDGTNYFGMSLMALLNLAKHHGYSLVYATGFGVNAFLVRDDLVKKEDFKHINDIDNIYKSPKFGEGPRGSHKEDSLNRDFLSSASVLL